jgi:hypothetical protein
MKHFVFAPPHAAAPKLRIVKLIASTGRIYMRLQYFSGTTVEILGMLLIKKIALRSSHQSCADQ